MTTKIVKSTSRGQITLPKQWRDQYGVDNYVMEVRADSLILKPLTLKNEPEVIIKEHKDGFDMTFPNGISPDEIIAILEDIEA
jgi:bifunctional DNA-binding transcriptional regulator/antitoxin component of YhaV-PrlF toxin-antitoxin module